uniref:Uncharacterized protein n=1 Tax=Anopheles farauti TaxID=69004 RepID=A0A182QCV8_9DIPT
METVRLFKAMGERVATLPAPQQKEIIDSVLHMIDASQKLNHSAPLAQSSFQRPPQYNLTKSVSHSATTFATTSATSTTATLFSSPSYILGRPAASGSQQMMTSLSHCDSGLCVLAAARWRWLPAELTDDSVHLRPQSAIVVATVVRHPLLTTVNVQEEVVGAVAATDGFIFSLSHLCVGDDAMPPSTSGNMDGAASNLHVLLLLAVLFLLRQLLLPRCGTTLIHYNLAKRRRLRRLVRAPDEVDRVVRYTLEQIVRKSERALRDVQERFLLAVTPERRQTGQQDVGHHADRPDVGLQGQRIVMQHLGRDVVGRADDLVEVRNRFAVHVLQRLQDLSHADARLLLGQLALLVDERLEFAAGGTGSDGMEWNLQYEGNLRSGFVHGLQLHDVIGVGAQHQHRDLMVNLVQTALASSPAT